MMLPALPPPLRAEPLIVTADTVPDGHGRTLLLIVAHGDDPGFFVGGVVALWARAGWRIVCLRVTDDSKDSVGLTEAETITRNDAEFREAAGQLGLAAVEDLGWRTDVLGDVSRVALRERLIHAIRRHRPYGLVTFDPDSLFHEDNLDHRVLAQAADEAFWCAQFDKHHSEHFDEGLDVHGVYERWYFGRTVAAVSHVFDTATTIGAQIAAVMCHKTMLANIARQLMLQCRTAGLHSSLIEAADGGDLRPWVEAMVRRSSAAKGAPYGLDHAELMRLSRARLV